MSNKGLLLRQNMTNIANAIRNNGGSILPKEYTEIEYIESTGTQYIDTGVKPYITETDIKFAFSSLDNDKTILGSYNDNNNRYYPVSIDGGGNITIRNRSNTQIYGIQKDTNTHHIIYNDMQNDVYFDEVNVGKVTNLTTSDTRSLTLFARHSSNIEAYSKAKIYYCKLCENGILVRNFIPCYRNSDGEAGLYDTVNNVFYTNQGTGTFIKGPEVQSQFKPREMAQGIDNLADLLRNYIPHRKVTGNPLSVDAIALKPKELAIDGDCKQDSTTGKNKFDISTLRTTRPNYTVTAIDRDTYKYLINATGTWYNCPDYRINNIKPNTSYTLSYDVLERNLPIEKNSQIYLDQLDVNGTTITGTNNVISSTGNGTITVTTESATVAFVIKVVTEVSTTTVGSYLVLHNVQVEEGSTATPYEPYTGGQPSPNPDYPQEVRTVKGTNGTIALKKTGKNLFKFDDNLGTIVTKGGITVSLNNDGTITINGTATSTVYFGLATGHGLNSGTISDLTYKSIKLYSNKNYTMSVNKISGEFPNNWHISNRTVESGWQEPAVDGSKTFTGVTGINETYIAVTSGQNFNNFVFNIQLEEGSTATAYEPYKSATIPFTIGNTEFCKIGTVTDKLWVNLRTGQYGKISNINKITFTSENIDDFEMYYGGQSFGFNLLRIKKSSLGWKNAWTPGIAILNRYKEITSTGAVQSGTFGLNFIEHEVAIWDNRFTDLASAKQALMGTVMYIQLATPTTESLGTLSATDLANLRLYAGTNNIELQGYEDDGTEPVIELDYYYDYNELTEALLDLGGE